MNLGKVYSSSELESLLDAKCSINIDLKLDTISTLSHPVNGSLGFINKVGEIAEKENHHPDITFGWGYCSIKIFTHAIKGLAESDFILAAKIDQI